MQRKFQHTFTKSKMNQDLDARLLSADEYREGVNISVSRAEADDVGALENILGNSLLSNLNSTSDFITQIVGWFFNQDTNKVYIFDTSYQDNSIDQISDFCPVGTQNRIIVVNLDSEVFTTIVKGRFLNFSWNSMINDIVILEDLMFWTDNRNQPRMINIATAESDTNYYFNEDHISVAKYNPYKPIALKSEFNPRAWFFPYDMSQKQVGQNWNSIYNFFILDPVYEPTKEYQIANGTSVNEAKDSNTVASLRNNIGCQGYLKSETTTGSNEFELYEFRVAATSISKLADRNGQKLLNALIVFVDRDLTGKTPVTNPLTPAATSDISPLFFVDQTSKNVSSPWLRENQFKLTVSSVSPNTGTDKKIYYAPIAGGDAYGSWYQNALYNLGSAVPYYSLNKGGGSGQISKGVYELLNHFPKNIPSSGGPLNPDSSIGYIRVMHPKLDNLKYYVVTAASDPGTSASVTPSLAIWFKIRELTSFVNGTLSDFIDPTSLGIVANDQLSFYWPNSFYDYEFPGDPNFLEDKFVRFSYRFKFDDGQYSLIAPFTQETFIPKQKGYFLKDIGEREYNENTLELVNNTFIPQEDLTGERTINNFMENEVTNVVLNILLEYKVNELAVKLKVDEIDILYKDASTNNINVIDTIPITDESITTNSTKTFQYTYQSKSPIKTLRSAETTRVYDLAPVRAKTLSASGNRIIYGNFFDKHTSPEGLGYFVCANQKMTPGSITQSKDVIIGTPKNNVSPYLPNTFANVAYPNHSLKQNRTYQVGLILQDRYGRSSDVILSKFSKTNFTLRDGVYKDDPLVFFGSTFFHDYLDSVQNPFTPENEILTSNKLYSGIVNWPGDSLKMLFTEELPRTISYANGYPGLYEDPFTSAPMISAPIVDSTSSVSYIELPAGFTDNVQPGMQIQWATSATDSTIKTLLVKSVIINATYTGAGTAGDPYNYFNRIELTDKDGKYVALSQLPPLNVPGSNPVIKTPMQFIEAGNPLGWYSYKVVVKQLEQDYYNVFLPSLLSGTPVVKPFKLKCSAAASSNIFTVDPIGTMEFLTFPLVRGMKLKADIKNTSGVTATYVLYISNILNYTQFETTQIIFIPYTGSGTPPVGGEPATNVNFEFSTSSSIGILNTTTLITDNANKVPPALEEASPVQQNFATSNVELIPRFAFSNKWARTNNIYNEYDNFNVANTASLPIFPGKQTLKVQSIGNFESLFARGTYFGLYNADTDPPSAVIEDKFNLGQNSNLVKPANEAPMVAACYETTPVKSDLEIYYESSTSGTVKELNQLVRDNLVIPSFLRNSTTGQVLASVNIDENLDFSAGGILANFNIIDQDGNILNYLQAEGFSISTTQYSNGTAINPAPFTVERTNNANSDEYSLKATETNPLYSSDQSGLNFISFNINFTFLQFNVLPIVYQIPLNGTVQNAPPDKSFAGQGQSAFVDPDGLTYYFWNAEGSNPPPKKLNTDVESGDPYKYLETGWNNFNGLNTSLSKCTNGSDDNNVNAGAELAWTLWVSFDLGSTYRNITAEPISGFGLSLGTVSGQLYNIARVINIGTFSGSYLGAQATPFTAQIRATDQGGNGITTIVSEFKFVVVDQPVVLKQFNATNATSPNLGIADPDNIPYRQSAAGGGQTWYIDSVIQGNTTRQFSNGVNNWLSSIPYATPSKPSAAFMQSLGYPSPYNQYNLNGIGVNMVGEIITQQGEFKITSNGNNYAQGDVVFTALKQTVVQTPGSPMEITTTVSAGGALNAYYVVSKSLQGETPPA